MWLVLHAPVGPPICAESSRRVHLPTIPFEWEIEA
jgi:hypothetical protein